MSQMEGAGTGTNRIVEEMLKNKSQEPVFLSRAGSFVIKLIGPKEEFTRKEDFTRFEEKEYTITKDLNKRQIKAMDFIKNQKEITRKDYMKINKVSNKAAYIELNSMLKKGIVKVVVSADTRTMLSMLSTETYKIVNKENGLRTPNLIDYFEFRKRYVK